MRDPVFWEKTVMKSKKIICGAVAAAITMSVAFSGCGLLTTINEEDMKQTIATVNISKSDKLGDLKDYASAIKDEVIIKRDLVNAFINVGSNYVNSGMSYEAAFNSLVSELTNNAVVVQYATAYVLKSKVEEKGSTITLAEYNAKTTEAAKYEYLLDEDSVLEAQYNLYVSLNNALDSYEVTEADEDEDYVGTDTRSTPSGIDATVDDYLPTKDKNGKKVLDYGVYTGYEEHLLSDAGKYEGKDKTNRNTRRQAYSRFLKGIQNNYLLTSEDKDLTNVLELSYVQSQYVSQLQQSLINEFNDIYTEEQEAKINMLDANKEYSFVKDAYNSLLNEQEQTYSDSSTFENAMSGLSDTKFVLYSPDTTGDTELQQGGYGTFGYVYNILLPFSVTQSKKLTKLQGYRDDGLIDDGEYFQARNELLRNIETTDQREAWFNGATDYSFNATEYNTVKEGETTLGHEVLSYYGDNKGRDYLFFENNLTKLSEYKPLEKYTGLYAYNGKATKNTDGSYTLVPNKLSIDDMLVEFSEYINYVLGGRPAVSLSAGDSVGANANYAGFYDTKPSEYYDKQDDKKIDYSKLVYATGRVAFNALDENNTSNVNMFAKDSERYKVMSAVNELQYAYTTDTGVLSQYIGYSVSAYETSYIKEFEYAAQQALRMGVGAFKVCAGDYGWHLIYVTDAFSFEGGEVYKTAKFTKERIEIEGTFENRFYNWIKDSTLNNETTQKRTEILQYFSNDTTITKYVNAYKDLLNLG